MNPQNVHKVLTIAESIVRALDDGTIFDRYMRIKNKIMEDSTQVPPQLRKLIVENQELAERIKQIQNEFSKSDNNYLKNWVISQMDIAQNQILPKAIHKPSQNFETAAKSLLEVIDTKLMSHQFLKQKLTDENEQLREAIQTMRNEALTKIDQIKKNRIDFSSEWHRNFEKMRKEIEDNEAKIVELNETMPTDTEELKNKLNSSLLSFENPLAKSSETEAEKRLSECEQKRNKLRTQLQRLKFSIEKIDIELEGLKKLQKTMEAAEE